MVTPYVPAEVVNRRPSSSGRKRFMLVIVLSTILILLGTITLSTSAFWENNSSLMTTHKAESRHTVVPTQIPTPKPTASPTNRSAHAPILGYPLLNGNTHIREIALTFDDGPNPYYLRRLLCHNSLLPLKPFKMQLEYVQPFFVRLMEQLIALS